MADVLDTGEIEPTLTPKGAGDQTQPERRPQTADKALRVSREEPGRYDIREEKGRGGMGRVLVAFDGYLGRDVAFKELLGVVDQDAAARFLREARITGQLEHPNIVPVHEVGRAENGSLYYTMRLVHGRTLTEAFAECRTLSDRLRYLGAFWNLCNAVAFAHSRGVVHRDLKPDNVMVGEFGETVLIDWGIARVDRSRPQAAMSGMLGDEPEPTRRGAVGTPRYMSPEQASGDQSRVDARSDVWGLGAVLHELLTGSAPFAGKSVTATLELVQHSPLRPIREQTPQAPPELVAVAEKALAKRPEDRFQSALEFAEEIHAYISGGLVRAYAYSPWDLVRRFAAQHRAAVAAGGLVLVAVLAALAVVSVSLGAEQRARRGAELNLARAYIERAQRALGEVDLDAARRFAAASLLHNPASVYSPAYDASFARQTRAARAAEVEASSTLFQAEARRIVELEREFPTREIVGAVAFSGDGVTLASGDKSRGEVRIWAAATGELQRSLGLSPGEVWALALSHDGSLLARGASPAGLEVWDAKTGRRVWVAENPPGMVLTLAFTRQDMLLATFQQGPPRLFDGPTGRVIASLGPEYVGGGGAITPDGTKLVSTSKGVLHFFGLPGLVVGVQLEPGAGRLHQLAISPDGRT